MERQSEAFLSATPRYIEMKQGDRQRRRLTMAGAVVGNANEGRLAEAERKARPKSSRSPPRCHRSLLCKRVDVDVRWVVRRGEVGCG